MDVRGAVRVVLRGPEDEREAALDLLRRAQIHAEPDPHEVDAIWALFYGADAARPSPQAMDACAAQTAEAALGMSFAVEETGTLEVSADRRLVCRRDTGEWLGAYLDTSRPPAQRAREMDTLAREADLDRDDLELRELPASLLAVD